MKVLGLCSPPVSAAATRFRLSQFVEPLGERGIELTIKPFLTGDQFTELYRRGRLVSKVLNITPAILNRFAGTLSAKNYDVMLVQREAMIFGPAIFEWLYQWVGHIPMVLDLDDATYVPYISPTYGRLGSFFKFFGKTDKLIERSELVICGNRFIAEYVNAKGRQSVVIPTVVDESVFTPIEKNNDIPVIGWIGTHSTFPFLETIFPVLTELAEKHSFKLKIVGSGQDSIEIAGVQVETRQWSLEREVVDFQSLDIGLYPISVSSSASSQWLNGKSGFKAIQYMAVGVPFVMSPVGVCAEMGIDGPTHFNATSQKDWYNHLNRLLTDKDLRTEMGKAGRLFAVKDYSLAKHAQLLADTLNGVSDEFTARKRH